MINSLIINFLNTLGVTTSSSRSISLSLILVCVYIFGQYDVTVIKEGYQLVRRRKNAFIALI